MLVARHDADDEDDLYLNNKFESNFLIRTIRFWINDQIPNQRLVFKRFSNPLCSPYTKTLIKKANTWKTKSHIPAIKDLVRVIWNFWVLWHTNRCRLFNAKLISILMNSSIFKIQYRIGTQFQCKKQFYFKHSIKHKYKVKFYLIRR